MINVSICDDEQGSIDILLKYIERWAAKSGENIKTKTYCSPRILLADFSDDVDILLLDIRMKELDGIETARALREKNRNVCILFITSIAEAAIECYRVRAFSFLTKPLSYAEFELEFSDAVRTVTDKKDEYLYVNSDNTLHKIRLHDILYIEVLNHTIALRLRDGQRIESYGSLKDIEGRVEGKGFFRCHSGYLINHSYISEIGSTRIKMSDGSLVPLSRHRKAEFLSEVCRYVGVRI